jgi:hypothetical protein
MAVIARIPNRAREEYSKGKTPQFCTCLAPPEPDSSNFGYCWSKQAPIGAKAGFIRGKKRHKAREFNCNVLFEFGKATAVN